MAAGVFAGTTSRAFPETSITIFIYNPNIIPKSKPNVTFLH
jgi:hypothetical protein